MWFSSAWSANSPHSLIIQLTYLSSYIVQGPPHVRENIFGWWILKGSEKEKVLTKIRAEIRILTGALLDRVELQGWKKKKKKIGKGTGKQGSPGKKQWACSQAASKKENLKWQVFQWPIQIVHEELVWRKRHPMLETWNSRSLSGEEPTRTAKTEDPDAWKEVWGQDRFPNNPPGETMKP